MLLERIAISFQQGADPNLLAKGRESALSLACSKGYTDIVKMLIDCRVDVNEYDWVRHLLGGFCL